MSNVISITEEQIEGLVPAVARRVRSMMFWIYKNVYNEDLEDQDVTGAARTAIFEALYDNADASEKEIIESSVKICKSYLWGKGTWFYDKYRRNSTGKARIKAFADEVYVTPWGEEINLTSEEGVPTSLNVDDIENPAIEDIFEKLEKQLGPELAMVYVLHYGYDWSISKIIQSLMGFDKGSDEFNREGMRISRLLKNIKGKLNK